jgi:hypothetical protein
MKKITIVCLATLAVALSQRPAEAGRRARRAARRTTAVVAAAAVVAPRRTTVVAAAPVIVAPRTGAAAAALPDLTITSLRPEPDSLVITVANIGRAPSPLTHLKATLHRQSTGVLLGVQPIQVAPLAVGQSVEIRLRAIPLDDVHYACVVDPYQEVAEISELNNDRTLAIAPRPVPPPVLQDEVQWQPPVE